MLKLMIKENEGRIAHINRKENTISRCDSVFRIVFSQVTVVSTILMLFRFLSAGSGIVVDVVKITKKLDVDAHTTINQLHVITLTTYCTIMDPMGRV